MIRIRYLTLLMLLLCSISFWAQNDTFNPADPPEPEQPAMRLDLNVTPSEAGSVSGGGRYSPGKNVNLSVYTNTGFRFVKWTNANGETVSTTKDFTYTKQEGHETLTANFIFDPSAPADPAEPGSIMYYKLSLTATEGGYVSGGGSYLAGKPVSLQANCYSGFDFLGWYNNEGECLCTDLWFHYTTTAKHVMLTARFAFNPNSPSEPSQPTIKPKHNLVATCTEGGGINWAAKRLEEGQTVPLVATTNSGYRFLGWFLNGELYTMLTNFIYTVTSESVQNFEARWEFDPDSPSEPNAPTTTKHAFFLMNKVTKPGQTVKFPIYLSNVKTLTDMTFQLEFPEVMTPDFETVEMSEKAVGYSVSYLKVDDTNYIFSLTGGSVPVGNSALLVFTINVADNVATAQNYQIKINQVSVIEEGGNSITASTRNGRISVYRNGDANGDDVVDALDGSLILQYVAHKFGDENANFIKEAADTNNGNEVDALDASLVLQHAAKKIDLDDLNTSE